MEVRVVTISDLFMRSNDHHKMLLILSQRMGLSFEQLRGLQDRIHNSLFSYDLHNFLSVIEKDGTSIPTNFQFTDFRVGNVKYVIVCNSANSYNNVKFIIADFYEEKDKFIKIKKFTEVKNTNSILISKQLEDKKIDTYKYQGDKVITVKEGIL